MRLLLIFGILVCWTCTEGARLPLRSRAWRAGHLKQYQELIEARKTRAKPSGSVEPKPHHGFLRIQVAPPSEIPVAVREDLDIACEVSGNPPPAVYWLKNGKPIPESPFEIEDYVKVDDLSTPKTGLASTRSRLYIPCITEEAEAIYTCVGESPYDRVVSSTYVRIQGYNQTACDYLRRPILPTRIYMMTSTYVDQSGRDGILTCRATGIPRPKTTWLNEDGEELKTGPKYEVLPSGDLLIRKLEWSDMGGYVCSADNGQESDKSLTFLYPLASEDDDMDDS